MDTISIIPHTNGYGHQISLFKIRLKDRFVYMNVGNHFLGGRGLGGPEKVIVIDSKKFLKLWKNDPRHSERHLALGNETIWRNDYKFHLAEKGFSFGCCNPVPLAYLHCYLSDVYENFVKKISTLIGNKATANKIPYCSFTNGITRTIWLLANGAESFPVMTDIRSYDLLLLHAGISESEELINNII